MDKKDTVICEECGSAFIKRASKMAGLCPECSHYIYGYPNCNHVFENGRCVVCGWDGSESEFIKGLKKRL